MTDSKQIAAITDLTTDPHNLNVGTERGLYVLDDSLSEVGAGRSIVADRGGVVLAGNKTLQVAADKGFPVRVVQTDGSELVVVQRTDLDLSGEGEERKRAQRLAVYDNRAGQLGLEWDAGEMAELLEEDGDIFEGLFYDKELEILLSAVPGADAWSDAFGNLPDGDRAPFQQMTFTLHDTQVEQVKAALGTAKAQGEFVDSPNQNSNGNALARICETFLTDYGQG